MINVIGLGYIGLPTALMLAAHDNEVVGTDIKKEIVDNLKEKKLTFEEQGMEELFKTALSKKIRFETAPVATDFYIITTPTPYDAKTKKIDCSYVINALKSVLPVALEHAVIVVESTVSPGSMDNFIRPVVEEYMSNSGKTIHLAHAPERIIPGNMVHELLTNARTIGADDETVGEKVKQIYTSFCQGEISLTDIKTAEMTKVVENTFRDINIAFANELAKICREANMDVHEVIRIANKHPRVNILSPGPGVGGHCISVDPWFLVGEYPYLTKLIYQARQINDSMPEFVLRRIGEIMEKHDLHDFSRVGLYGLTYKENVDDIRESPTLQLLESMKRHLATGLKVYDPMVKRELVQNQYHDLDAFLKDVDLLVLMVGHDEIKKNFSKLNGKIILDTRNIFPLEGCYTL